MTWNYRILHRYLRSEISPDEIEHYGIHEVYYDDDDGSICSYTEEPIPLCADSLEELKDDLLYITQAFDKPVLEYGKITPDELGEKEGC
jgi:hypothetical protein